MSSSSPESQTSVNASPTERTTLVLADSAEVTSSVKVASPAPRTGVTVKDAVRWDVVKEAASMVQAPSVVKETTSEREVPPAPPVASTAA